MACGFSFNDAGVLPFITFGVKSTFWISKGNSFLLWSQSAALSAENAAASAGIGGFSGLDVRRLGYLFAGPQDATQIGCALQVGACLGTWNRTLSLLDMLALCWEQHCWVAHSLQGSSSSHSSGHDLGKMLSSVLRSTCNSIQYVRHNQANVHSFQSHRCAFCLAAFTDDVLQVDVFPISPS
jgi:hypothetical protein